MLSGRSLNLVDLVNGGNPCVKAELLRPEDWPKVENPVELPNLRADG